MKKPCDKTVLSAEEEIRKHAKQARKTINERLHNFESSGYVRDFVAIRVISQFEEDVLGVLRNAEAEHQKHLEAVRETWKKAYEGTVQKDREGFTKKLTEAWQSQPEITIAFSGDPQSTEAMIQSLLEQNRKRQKWNEWFEAFLSEGSARAESSLNSEPSPKTEAQLP